MKNQENELQILNAYVSKKRIASSTIYLLIIYTWNRKYSALKENYKKYHEQFKRLKDGGVILIKREAKTPVVVSGSTSSKNSSGKPGRSGKPTVSFSLPTNVKSWIIVSLQFISIIHNFYIYASWIINKQQKVYLKNKKRRFVCLLNSMMIFRWQCYIMTKKLKTWQRSHK